MTSFKGFGNSGVSTLELVGGLTAQHFYRYPMLSFELTEEVGDPTELRAFSAGELKTEEIIKGSTTTTIKLSTEIINWSMLGVSLGEVEKTLANFTLPIVKRGTVPEVAPFEINDAELVAGNIGSVLVGIEAYGSWGQTGPVPRSTVAPTARQVLVAAGKLTFNAAQAGAPVSYVINKTYTSAKAYGGPGATTSLGRLQFFGEIYDTSATSKDGALIWVPRMESISAPTLAFSDGTPTLETTFQCLNISTFLGRPYAILDAHSLVA